MHIFLYIGFLGLAGILAAYVGYILQLCFRQNSYVYHPLKEIMLTPDSLGMAYEEVAFKASDGTELSAWFVPCGGEPRATVLFCHGNASNIGSCMDHLKTFHELKTDVLVFDYRGYGNSSGKPNEPGTYMDSDAAWDYLIGQKGLPHEKILLFGYSLGGAVAARLASLKCPGGLVLLSSFTSMPDMAEELYPLMPIRWLCRFEYDTIGYVRKTRCPVFVAHSVNDEVVPFGFGERLFAAASEPRRFLGMKGSHGSCISESGELYTKALDEFVHKHISPEQADA